MKNSDNYPISSDSDDCMSEFRGGGYSKNGKN